MADFQFGHISASMEAGRHADANLDFSPPDLAPFSFLDGDFTNFVNNQDRIYTVEGSSTDFIWGQRWGNSKTRVTK